MAEVRSKRRVVVSGLGIVSPFGGSLQDFHVRLVQGQSAAKLYHHPTSPTPLAQVAVTCSEFDPVTALGRPLAGICDRYSQLGLAAAFSAWDDASLPREGEGRERYGVSWGTGAGALLTLEQGYAGFYLEGRERASPLSVVMGMSNAAASHIAIQLGLGAACLTYSMACASSAVSIGEAFRRIQAGDSDLIVAGGSEAPLSFSMMRAWEAMRVVAKGSEETAHGACRPFDAGRTGLVLAEGGAALVLEEREHALARGVRIYAEMVGYGQSCDHMHLAKPCPEGQVRALRGALEEAGLAPDEIGYVNAHGTATQEGDPAEIEALRAVFGKHALDVLVSSTKSMHGHALGAAGAIEALVTVMALSYGEIPPTAHLEEVASECEGVAHVRTGLHGQTLRSALSSSFAFGGSNAVLAFRAAD